MYVQKEIASHRLLCDMDIVSLHNNIKKKKPAHKHFMRANVFSFNVIDIFVHTLRYNLIINFPLSFNNNNIQFTFNKIK